MLDRVVIDVAGGDGGHGLVSYHREKFVPQGGPDGGDGGHGGRVIIRAVADAYTLEQYRSRQRFKAGTGAHGGPNLRSGAVGADLVLEVPAGTVVSDAETGELIADLKEAGDQVVVARGGRGGWGNKKFATSTNQTPSYSQRGAPGERRLVELELRLLADVGLLGLPNAGKSTLLAAVSNAKPKVAAYPFTTLEPMLGVVDVDYDRFTLADLPGLVEGASEGYGLGFEFLKHVRRCRVLLHVVDSTSPDAVTDYELIEGEVRAYDERLAQIPRVLAVTKADLGMEAATASARALQAHTGLPAHVISAHDGTGIEALVRALMAMVKAERKRAAEMAAEEAPVLRPQPRDRFEVVPDGDGRWLVEGARIVQFVEMTNTGMEGAKDEIIRRLERWGVAKELRRQGAQLGDAVVFGTTEIEWEG
jgi:GTP-binding protein